MGIRRLLDHAGEHEHEAVSDVLDELEERLEDVEDAAPAGLVPNHDHNELSRSIEAIQHDIQELQRQLVEGSQIPLAHLSGLEERVAAVERHAEHPVEVVEHPVETTEDAAESALELPEEVVIPKKRHWFHDAPKWI